MIFMTLINLVRRYNKDIGRQIPGSFLVVKRCKTNVKRL